MIDQASISPSEPDDAPGTGACAPPPLNAMDYHCWLMRIVTVMARAEVDRRMEPLGLTQAQWMPVLHLAAGRAQTAAELARNCMQSPGAMTRMIDRLVDKGIIERERSTTDRRVVRLRLTPEGQRCAVQLPDIVKGVNQDVLSPLSAEERQQFQGYLLRVYTALPQTVHCNAELLPMKLNADGTWQVGSPCAGRNPNPEKED
ncbi:MAG: MarR family winged helix-turn-helix transcriptional regulator [Comamonas sp.]